MLISGEAPKVEEALCGSSIVAGGGLELEHLAEHIVETAIADDVVVVPSASDQHLNTLDQWQDEGTKTKRQPPSAALPRRRPEGPGIACEIQFGVGSEQCTNKSH